MFDFVKSIFSPSVVNKTVDGIYNGVDKAFYTDEEKAEALQKQVDSKMKLLPLFEPFKLAQRIIAISFTFNFILAFWIGVVLLFMEKLELLDKFIALIGVFQLGWIMMAIVAWYFTGGIINSTKGKTND